MIMRVTILNTGPTLALATAVVCSLAVAQARAGDECRAAVEAAFNKQRVHVSGYRFAAQMPGEQGATQMTIDYLPPDRMYQKVEAPGNQKPVETIAIQRWAWGTMGGGWEELQPQFAQSIIAHVRSTLIDPPKLTSAFTCLGKVKLEGKERVAYRADQPSAAPGSAGEGAQLARTIYVDETSGLPLANIVTREDGKGDVIFDGRYSYPTDISIEPPIGGHAIVPHDGAKNAAEK